MIARMFALEAAAVCTWLRIFNSKSKVLLPAILRSHVVKSSASACAHWSRSKQHASKAGGPNDTHGNTAQQTPKQMHAQHNLAACGSRQITSWLLM
jgi:hypothetical protein